jgi:hypothetical protein
LPTQGQIFQATLTHGNALNQAPAITPGGFMHPHGVNHISNTIRTRSESLTKIVIGEFVGTLSEAVPAKLDRSFS